MKDAKTDASETTKHEVVRKHLESHFDKVDELNLLLNYSGIKVYKIVVKAGGLDCVILATSGANLKNEKEKYDILMYFPKDWDFSGKSNPANLWLLEWMIELASYENDIQPQNTFSAEDQGAPIGEGTDMNGFMVLTEDNEYGVINSEEGRRHRFLVLLPVYKEEIELKNKMGTLELLKRFEKNSVDKILNLKRPNVGDSEVATQTGSDE